MYVKLRLRRHCRLPSYCNDTFTLRIMSLQRHSQCDRGERKNECARGRTYSRVKEGKGDGGYVCIGAYRKTEERRKKNSRKRSGALAEQKGTKLISEALTNYFLRKGVGYLQLSTHSLPLTPSLYLFASEAAAPPTPLRPRRSLTNSSTGRIR